MSSCLCKLPCNTNMEQKKGLVVYSGGTFDLFHYGHTNFLMRCSDLAGPDGRVIVSVNTDEFIEKYKGHKPVMSLEERMAVLLACAWVDDVIVNVGDEDSKPAILSIHPDVVAISSDWARKDYYKQMQFSQDWLDEQHIILAYIPHTLGISSTDIRSRLKQIK